MIDAVIITPIGHLGLTFSESKLISIQFLKSHILPFPITFLNAQVKKTIQRFGSYFNSPQNLSDLPYFLEGSVFQRKVWQALRKIPLGQTRTYGELAEKLGTSARAIGLACRRNPLPIVIPCHRVVAASGLGGFCGETAGQQIAIKQWLLMHEKIAVAS